MQDRLMGIDYGAKRIGVAVSDEEGKVAFPKEVVPNTKGAMEHIQDLARSADVHAIVIGHSLNNQGNPNPIMKEITVFKEKLEDSVSIPVRLEPEFYTSQEAARGGTEASLLDAAAAALILQSYIDRHRS